MQIPTKRILSVALISLTLLCVLLLVRTRPEPTMPEIAEVPNPALEEGQIDETSTVQDSLRTEVPKTDMGSGSHRAKPRVSSEPDGGLLFAWRKSSRTTELSSSDPIDLARLTDGSNAKLDSFERKRKKAAPGIEFRRFSLQDEKGRIPVDGLQKARRQMDRMRASQDAKARAAGEDPDKVEMAGIEPGAWAWLGPGNVGGRVRAINIDTNNPLNILAASVSGGLWRTTNAGVSWQPVDDFMANLAVSTIVRSPNTSTLLYAGTGEGFTNIDSLKGGGVFRSTDGGTTWSLVASTDPVAPNPPGCGVGAQPCSAFWSYVNRLAIAPDGTMLAATGGSDTSLRPSVPIAGGIARSNNGGASWTQQTATTTLDVDVDPNNSANAIASQLTNCGPAPAPPAPPLPPCIIVSTDGGVNWNASNVNPAITNGGTAPTNARTELAYAPSLSNVIYASVNQNQGDIYQSTDWGQNFTKVDNDNPTPNNLLGTLGWYANALWVNPRDPTFIIVGGVNLFQSGDSGSTFALKADGNNGSAHVDHHVIVSNPTFDDNNDKSVYFGNDGGVYRVDDIRNFSQTAGWTELNNNLGVTQFFGGAVTPNGVVFGGTQDNGTIRVSRVPNIDPPYNSESWAEIYGSDGGYVAADPTDANYLYGETQRMGLVRSTDGGATASFIYCNPAPPTTAPTVVCAPPATGITDAIVAGAANSANFIAPFILDPNDSNTMLAGGVSLWRSTDVKTAGLPTWAVAKNPNPTIPPPPPPPAPPPAPIPNPISAIAVSPVNSNLIVVGHNDGQIWVTTNGLNGSPAWINRTPPVPPAPALNFARFVTRLAVDATRNPNWIYATLGGFSDGNVIRSEDLGATWIDVSGTGATSLPQVPVRSIVINPAVADKLYVGTEVGIFASEDAGATWQLPNSGPANVSVDELFWYQGDLVAATHGRGMYKTHVPVIDTTSCIVVVDSGVVCPGTTCAPGLIACPGSNCTCCTAGAWQCPCSWNTQKVPTENDDPYVACPMTGGGGARNITIGPGGGITFNGSGGLRTFIGDFVNFGFVRVINPFGSSQIAADGNIQNLGSGTIQMPGSISAGGVLANYGLIAVSSDVNAKGLVTGSSSTLTFNRMTIEGDVNHSGLAQENGLLTFQSIMDFKSPPGMISTFSGPGVWSGPRGAILPGSSFRLGGNVTMGLADFRNSGTLDVQAHQLTFTGSTFTNDPGQLANGRGVLGTGIVNFAPSTGNATFVTGRREIPQEVEFTPQLKISSGNVIAFGNVGGVVVDAGATIQADIMDVNGDMTVNGTIAPLSGSTVLNFNGGTLTNNGAIGNLRFLNFNRSGAPRMQTIQGVGTWSPLNVQLGLYPPSTSTTTLSLENDIRFSNNSFIVSTGSTLALGTRTMTLAGPTFLTNDGTISGFFALVRMEASGTGGRIGSIPGAVFGAPLEIATGQVRVNPTSSALSLVRHLNVNMGATFTMTGPAVSVAGEVTNNGTINTPAGTPLATFQYLGPRFINTGSISGSGLIFRFGSGVGGPTLHQLSGTGSWSAMQQILINAGSTLELLNDVSYSGSGLFLLGDLNTGTHTLSVPCTTSWGGPGETFGNVRRTNLAACPGAIAFGNPFTTIQFTSGTPPTELTFNVSPTSPFPSAARRTYLITPVGGSNYTATLRLHYIDSELNGNPESSLQLWRHNGTNWTALGATNRNTTDNWVEYAGVTQFSPWALSQLAPTAAGVSVRGRVSTSSGAGISRAVVRMDDSDGRGRTTITNTFGYFRFENVTVGESYVVSVSHKRYRFTPRLVDVSNDITGLDFIAEDFPRRFPVLRF